MAALLDIRMNREIPLHGPLTLIGRDPGCDIVADAPMVSARHCIILCHKGSYSVEDLDSLNGTFINGESLTGRTPLCPGDRISLIGLTLEFQDEASPAKAPQRRTATVARTSGHIAGGQTIRLSELADAPRVMELSSIQVDGDLRLSVKPEAKLRAVLEIARNLTHSLELDVVLPQILDSLFSIFPAADCGFILLRNQQTAELVPVASKYRMLRPEGSFPVSRGIIHQVLVSGRAILSLDAALDAGIKPTDSIRQLDIRSIMCVPIQGEDGECLGVIQLDSRDRASQFDQEDLSLLVCASLLAARAMDVARRHAERQELEAATRIQRSFLPTSRPEHPGLQCFAHYAPAQQVSGDYYDYIRLPGDRLAVVVGDVAGKGLSAALLMAHLAAATRVCLASSSDVADAVRQLNVLLLDSIADDRFITFVVAVLDLNQFRLTVINAGHPPPLLRRSQQQRVTVEHLAADEAGLPLGVRDCPYYAVETTLEPGDTLLLYTDGASEMRSPSGELFGLERLLASAAAAPGDAVRVGESVLNDLHQFAQSRPAGDDLTLLCLGRTV